MNRVLRPVWGLLPVALMAALLWQSAAVGQAVREGLILCVRSVIPSLFPFFVAVSLAVESGAFHLLRQLGLPVGAAVFLLGIVGGYPVGARTVGALCRAGQLSRADGARLLTFCNNAGLSFILSIAGGVVFGSRRAGLALYGIHAVSALAAGGLLGGLRRGTADRPDPVPEPPSPAAALVSAVGGGALAMVNVCAFVVFFLAVAALLRQLWPGLPPPLSGLLELTGGITSLHDGRADFCGAAALLGWGGLSVHCQTAAVLEGTGIPLGRYLLAKAVQAAISALLALAVCPLMM